MIKSTIGQVEMKGSSIELQADLAKIISALHKNEIIDANLLFYICHIALNKDVAKPIAVKEIKEDNYADELHDRLGKFLAELFEALSNEDEEED